MNREELNRIILQGNPEDWDSLEEMLIFKGDLNLRIELADREYSDTGDSFTEDWTEALPAVHPATKQVFWVHYGSTKVMEVHTVNIDQRTWVPLPDSDDHTSMGAWRYGFGKIIEAYRAKHGGFFSLDTILSRAGIIPEDN